MGNCAVTTETVISLDYLLLNKIAFSTSASAFSKTQESICLVLSTFRSVVINVERFKSQKLETLYERFILFFFTFRAPFFYNYAHLHKASLYADQLGACKRVCIPGTSIFMWTFITTADSEHNRRFEAAIMTQLNEIKRSHESLSSKDFPLKKR